jgi:hypothetical protein
MSQVGFALMSAGSVPEVFDVGVAPGEAHLDLGGVRFVQPAPGRSIRT